MQFCTELAPPWSRNLTTLEHVKLAAIGGLSGGVPVPGQTVNLPEDTEVVREIAAVSAMIENHIRRPKRLLQTQYQEYVSGTGGSTIMLSVTPVLSISGITLRGQSLTPDWILAPESGILFRPQGWEYTGRVSRDIEDTRVPGHEAPEFVVYYTGGYTPPELGSIEPPLPADIEQAAIVALLQWAQVQTQNLSVQRVRIGDFTTTYSAGVSNTGGVRGLPNPAIDLLAPYRRVD